MSSAVDTYGIGLVHPFAMGARDFVSATGKDLIKANVISALMIRKRELPWAPHLGSELHKLLDENMDDMLEPQALLDCRTALSHDPRILVISVTVTRSLSENSLDIEIFYGIAQIPGSGTVLDTDTARILVK